MDAASLKYSFEFEASCDAQLLVLGSLPGEVSLAQQQYYAHPSNQFWRLMAAVVDTDLPALPYDRRLQVLKAHGIALWDTIKSARRSGSLDAAIRDHRENPLLALIDALPALRVIAFNGRKAAMIGRSQLSGETRCSLIELPSSSAAYCAISFETKRAQWSKLRQFIIHHGESGACSQSR
jgi:double-stranded uracil-DNA glycosylase